MAKTVGRTRPWDGNQLVAYNLRRARKLRRWSLDEAAEKLEPYLGERWSVASFSAAERTVETDRVRRFDAHEILALARAFDLPLWWFFLPPDPTEETPQTSPGKLADARWLRQHPLTASDLHDLVFTVPRDVWERVRHFDREDKMGRGTLFPRGEGRAGEAAEAYAAGLLRSIALERFGDLETLTRSMIDLASQLSTLPGEGTERLQAAEDAATAALPRPKKKRAPRPKKKPTRRRKARRR